MNWANTLHTAPFLRFCNVVQLIFVVNLHMGTAFLMAVIGLLVNVLLGVA